MQGGKSALNRRWHERNGMAMVTGRNATLNALRCTCSVTSIFRPGLDSPNSTICSNLGERRSRRRETVGCGISNKGSRLRLKATVVATCTECIDARRGNENDSHTMKKMECQAAGDLSISSDKAR